MDLRRLRAGELVLAAAAAAALVSLFLPWYGVEGGGSLTGWRALTVVDVLLAACALAALGAVVLTAVSASPSPSIASEALLTILCLVGLLVLFVRVLALPEGFSDRLGGQWLGLAAVLALAGGALLAIRDERLSRPGHPTDPTGVPIAAPQEIETLPASPRGSAGAAETRPR